MITSTVASSWRWGILGGTFVAMGGGFLMLLIAAVAHDTASVPLLIFGAAWIAMGVVSRFQLRHVATTIQVAAGAVTFVSGDGQRTVDAATIEEVKRSRWDINHLSPIRVRISGDGVIKVAPRMTGLFEVLAELRGINPRVQIRDL